MSDQDAREGRARLECRWVGTDRLGRHNRPRAGTYTDAEVDALVDAAIRACGDITAH
ncbi:MAG: hypothetical protein H0V59_03270 [Nocardioidaceae bacterium]|nr:hypothetical protein [Nocardioidaceae bacterium]